MINRKVGVVPMAVGIAVGKKIREVREAALLILRMLILKWLNLAQQRKRIPLEQPG